MKGGNKLDRAPHISTIFQLPQQQQQQQTRQQCNGNRRGGGGSIDYILCGSTMVNALLVAACYQ
jgi:hypothetical protein